MLSSAPVLLLPPPSEPLVLLAGRAIAAALASGEPITRRQLQALLTDHFGGTDAEGRWSVRDAHVALELAQTACLLADTQISLTATGASADRMFAALENMAPAQTNRSEEQIEWQQFATPQLSGLFGVPNGQDQSPQLSWTAGPAKTKSYVVTMYDTDAPTGSGFWHWVVYGIPATTHALPAGAGALKSTALPKGSVQATNDAGMARYLGAAPPKGDQPHHYYLTVTALDTDKLPVATNASPALIGFTISSYTLARGDIIATARG